MNVIAGYRVVRKLGVSRDAEVHLGFALTPVAVHDPPSRTVALKLFSPGTDGARIEREMSIRTSLPPGTAAAVLDVARLADGRVCVVLEYLGGGSLTQVLSRGVALRPGEAVTILARAVQALEQMHAIGFSLPALGPSGILFDIAGRPVLAGLGRAEPHGADAMARTVSIRADCDRLVALLRTVFAALSPDDALSRRSEALAARFEMASHTTPFESGLQVLERSLFEWAAAEAVRIQPYTAGSLRRAPRDAATLAVPEMVAGTAARVAGGTGVAGVAGATGVADQASHAAPARRSIVVFLARQRCTRALSAVTTWGHGRLDGRLRGRRRIIFVAGLTVALTAAALFSLSRPVDGSGARTNPRQPEKTTTSIIPAPDPAALTAITGDDPLAATVALLRRRAECVAAASVLCLDQVDQAGSSLLATDSYTVRMKQLNEANPNVPSAGVPLLQPNAEALSLVERTGNAVLIAVAAADAVPTNNKPASLLIIRGEAGWRLREIFDY
ncbi:hypothetical protein GCM10027056_23040 [Glaciibacter psychrotolerans]